MLLSSSSKIWDAKSPTDGDRQCKPHLVFRLVGRLRHRPERQNNSDQYVRVTEQSYHLSQLRHVLAFEFQSLFQILQGGPKLPFVVFDRKGFDHLANDAAWNLVVGAVCHLSTAV